MQARMQMTTNNRLDFEVPVRHLRTREANGDSEHKFDLVGLDSNPKPYRIAILVR